MIASPRTYHKQPSRPRKISGLLAAFVLGLFLPQFAAAAIVPDWGQLATHPYWHKLLHYESSGWGWHSPVVEEDFFLSPEGKTTPQAELQALAQALERPTPPGHPRWPVGFPCGRGGLPRPPNGTCPLQTARNWRPG